jgi:hypothetical protein
MVPQMLAVLMVLGVTLMVSYEWKKPDLDRLREKDPYRYERFVDEVFRLHWVHAWRQYLALQNITEAQLYRERYRRWKRQWEENRAFRQDVQRKNAEARSQLNQIRNKQYDREMLELEQSHRKQDPALLRVHWEQATPWQKSLILRDRCVRYLSQELEDYRQRRRVKESLHGAALLALSRVANAGPGPLCREMVPLSHDAPSVHRALGRLKNGMNYYYFARLIDDIGIPDSELFTMTGKLNGMTRDFNGF